TCISWGRCPQMVRLAFAKLAAAVGAMGVAVTAAGGVAPAGEPIVDTKSSYDQGEPAVADKHPDYAAQLDGSALAQGYLRQFLDPTTTRDERERMVNSLRGMSWAQKYLVAADSVAGNCNNY